MLAFPCAVPTVAASPFFQLFCFRLLSFLLSMCNSSPICLLCSLARAGTKNTVLYEGDWTMAVEKPWTSPRTNYTYYMQHIFKVNRQIDLLCLLTGSCLLLSVSLSSTASAVLPDPLARHDAVSPVARSFRLQINASAIALRKSFPPVPSSIARCYRCNPHRAASIARLFLIGIVCALLLLRSLFRNAIRWQSLGNSLFLWRPLPRRAFPSQIARIAVSTANLACASISLRSPIRCWGRLLQLPLCNLSRRSQRHDRNALHRAHNRNRCLFFARSIAFVWLRCSRAIVTQSPLPAASLQIHRNPQPQSQSLRDEPRSHRST